MNLEKDLISEDQDVDEEQLEVEEVETYSATQVLEKLERAWLNEKLSPELLEHHVELVDGMMEQIQELEAMIAQANKADFRVSIHLTEIDRIRYIIGDYMRCRLYKIEENAQYMVNNPIEQLKLTKNELSFVKGYWSSIEEYLQQSAFRHMPENTRNVNKDRMEVKPNTYTYIFLKANKPVTGIAIQEDGGLEEEVVDFDTNDQYLVPYKSIQSLLTDESVHLT